MNIPYTFVIFASISTLYKGACEMIVFGNWQTTSTKTYGDIGYPVSFVLTDFVLVSGTLREYRLTTVGINVPIWLQIWREEATDIYRLTYQQRFISLNSGNHSVKTEPVEVTSQDKIGFLEEGPITSLAYDFKPESFGISLVITTFDNRVLPEVGNVHQLNKFDMAPWKFAISVIIDTEYGISTTGVSTTPDATTETSTEAVSWESTSLSITVSSEPDYGMSYNRSSDSVSATVPSDSGFQTTTEPITVPTSSDNSGTEVIGNELWPGKKLERYIGCFILLDHELPDGLVSSFNFYATGDNDTIYLQLWRQKGKQKYLLLLQEVSMPDERGQHSVILSKPFRVQKGDKLGFYNSAGYSGVAHNLADNKTQARTIFRRFPAGNMTTGNTYHFSTYYNDFKFSISVNVEADPTAMTTASVHYPTRFPNGDEFNWLILAFVLPCAFVLLVGMLVCFICWQKRRKGEGLEDRSRVYWTNAGFSPDMKYPGSTGYNDTFGGDTFCSYDDGSGYSTLKKKSWDFPRGNVHIGETLYETESQLITKAQVYDFNGKPGVTTVAVKNVKAPACELDRITFENEIKAMKTIPSHPNVLQLLGICNRIEPYLMIVEFFPFGNLVDHLREIRGKNLQQHVDAVYSNYTTTKDLISFGAQIARGLAFLNMSKIMSADLAARSVFLGENKTCKISNFGFARDIIECRRYEQEQECRLPVRWMAPETILSGAFSTKSDVWAFGVLLWEIVTLGATPYCELTADEVMKQLRKGNRLKKPAHCKDELYIIMSHCWKNKPQDRPTFDDLERYLHSLHEESTDLLQLEKYLPELYLIRDKNTPLEIV